jgi:hypothetical protein
MKQVVYIQRGGGGSITHFRDGPEHNGHSTPVWALSPFTPFDSVYSLGPVVRNFRAD